MLTSLKVSSLTCKCVFYRPDFNTNGGGPIKLNFEVIEINGVMCLVMFFKMSKNANFLVFSADNTNKLVTIWAIYLSTPIRCLWVLAENGFVYRLWT